MVLKLFLIVSHVLLCGIPITRAQLAYVPDMNRGAITRLDLTSGAASNVTTGESRPVGIAYDSTSGRIFWTDVGADVIRVCNSDGSSKTSVYTLPSNSEADGLALSSSDQRLFYTDTGTNVIAAVNFDGSNPQTLVSTNVVTPIGIALNLADRTMFWTEAGSSPKIEKANMDNGNGRTTVISNGITYPAGIAVDSSTNEIFWTDYVLYTIDKANLNGQNRANLVTETGERFYGIAVDASYIYVTSWSTNQLRRFSRSGGVGDTIGSATFGQLGGVALSAQGSVGSTSSTSTTVSTTTNTGSTSSSTSTSTTTTIPTTSDVAFCAARSSSLTPGADSIIYYDNVLINDGNGFDTVSSKFTAPQEDLYWVHMSIGIDVNSEADTYLTGTTRVANIIHLDAVYNGQDTTSHDEIFSLSAGNQLQILSAFRVYSDTYLQTSFSGFSIQSVSSSSAVAFSLALSASTTCAESVKVPFDLVNLDSVGGWDSATKEYVIPTTGTYVISLHTGSDPNGQHAVGIYVSSSSSVISTIQFGSTGHQLESLSKTVILELNAGNRIYAGCLVYLNSYIASGLRRQTSLVGFLYAPTRYAQATWSVASISTVVGLADPVQFLVVLTNRGSGWSSLSHQYTVQQSGVYYVTFTAGIAANTPARMELMVNGAAVANVFKASNNHAGINTRSRAIVRRFVAGDVLHIRLPSGYTLYSSDQRITSFSGFFLFP